MAALEMTFSELRAHQSRLLFSRRETVQPAGDEDSDLPIGDAATVEMLDERGQQERRGTGTAGVGDGDGHGPRPAGDFGQRGRTGRRGKQVMQPLLEVADRHEADRWLEITVRVDDKTTVTAESERRERGGFVHCGQD